MADETLSRDENRITVSGAITNDADEFIRALRIDDSTKRLLVSAVITAGGGGGTQYAVDDALGSTPTGTLAVAIRDDALSALTPIEGDAVGLRVDSTGALWTTISGSVGVTNSGLTELAAAINASSQMDVNLAASNATVTVSATDLDIRNLTSVSDSVEVKQATGTNLHAVIDSGTITTITNSVTVTGTVTANAGSNLNTSLLAVESGGNLATIAGDTTSIQTAVEIMDDWDNAASDGASVSGDVAHDSVDAGEPVKIGFKAYSPDGTTPGTAVAELDRSNGKSDLDGRQFVNGDHPRSLHKHLDGTAAYTDESIAADPGDGFQIIITNIIFSSGEAVAINFFLEEGSTKIFGPIYLEAVAGRGFNSGPIRLPVTASTAVTLTTSAANDQSFDCDYYIQAV